MKIGPKYKLARRFGSHLFDKTQTQKFALSLARRKNVRASRARTAYAEQVSEKQRIRFHYFITANQLANYTRSVIASRTKNQEESLYQSLERRLDNVILKSGFANSRQMARQMATHGHFKVNGKRVNIPSYQLSVGDVVEVRDGSKTKALFTNLEEKTKDMTFPKWLSVDIKALNIKIKELPEFPKQEKPFEFGKVIQFYKR